MGVILRLGGSAASFATLGLFLLMGMDEPLAINFRYVVLVGFSLAVWYIGVAGESRNALEKIAKMEFLEDEVEE